MKVKFGDLTVRQAKELCKKREKCCGCPIQLFCTHIFDRDPCSFPEYKLETEIDLPDEEESKNDA